MIKVGTIGTSFIAKEFVTNVNKIDGIQVSACYSRTLEKGEKFAKENNINNVYTDLLKMLESDIDLVYVASPNTVHYEQVKLALDHNKNVLCEKPFVTKYSQAKELSDLAIKKKLFLFEGATVLYLPNYKKLKEMMATTDNITLVSSNLSQYSSRYDAYLRGEITNAFDPKYGGGALADLNIYNMHFMCGLFGTPEQVYYLPKKGFNEVDVNGILVLKFSNFNCVCIAAKDSWSKRNAMIQTTEGYYYIEMNSTLCSNITYVPNKKEALPTINEQTENSAMYYEVKEIARIIDTNDYEQCYKLLDHSVNVSSVFEKAQQDGKLLY